MRFQGGEPILLTGTVYRYNTLQEARKSPYNHERNDMRVKNKHFSKNKHTWNWKIDSEDKVMGQTFSA